MISMISWEVKKSATAESEIKSDLSMGKKNVKKTILGIKDFRSLWAVKKISNRRIWARVWLQYGEENVKMSIRKLWISDVSWENNKNQQPQNLSLSLTSVWGRKCKDFHWKIKDFRSFWIVKQISSRWIWV